MVVPALNVSIQDNSVPYGYSPGYVFIAPYDNTQTGPCIFDKAGVCCRKRNSLS
jgi:hypothetical protein